MATRFRLYSTDITATATPDTAAQAPATLIAFDHDPIHSGGLQLTPPARRGSVIRTSYAMGNPSGLVARSGHPTPKPTDLMEVLLSAAPPGTVLGVLDDSLAVQCADGAYLIPEVCPANSKTMGALDFACGYLNQAEACQAVCLDHVR